MAYKGKAPTKSEDIQEHNIFLSTKEDSKNLLKGK